MSDPNDIDIDESDSDFAEYEFERERELGEAIEECIQRTVTEPKKNETENMREAYQRYLHDGGTFADDPRR